ncbi:uncharacterized protein si:ch211-242e8.1 isoform X1 [Electrophorus electricus]|uniref:uncharacterized protein si:ch211-242e8.1 isoform X1 n=1 Tax=Electrophorus electricus TaxID=8005 RepID=UPI0015CFE867|nr:uncharacterized protein si:ch211-242e8.1 isoform X1 [Electrophorus electricus]
MRSAWPWVLAVWGLSAGAPPAHSTSVNPILLMTTLTPPTEEQAMPTELPSSNETERTKHFDSLSCVSLLPPRRGSYYVEQGTGVSLGSILVFWCREGYQLVGSEKIACVLHAGVPRWSNYLPVCESIPKPDAQGLRMALLVSLISGMVILVMAVSFTVCCIQEHLSKQKQKHRTGRSRRREKHRSGSRRSPSWLVREELDWEAFPPPKIFNLSQRFERPAPHGSPLYSGVIRGCENRGSQESLLRSTHPGVYHADSQLYPNLVLQRVQTAPNLQGSPPTPVYLHISSPSSTKAPPHPSVPLP